jgi:pyruvate/2-oxoglutarate dehydrogenase complex dihydrolipoamide acyltransferase (E2) component
VWQRVALTIPALGGRVRDGDVLLWHCAVGEQVSVGQALFDVETSKAVVTVEAVVAGIVDEIDIPSGPVTVGDTVGALRVATNAVDEQSNGVTLGRASP